MFTFRISLVILWNWDNFLLYQMSHTSCQTQYNLHKNETTSITEFKVEIIISHATNQTGKRDKMTKTTSSEDKSKIRVIRIKLKELSTPR